jgi:hypothetical protein
MGFLSVKNVGPAMLSNQLWPLANRVEIQKWWVNSAMIRINGMGTPNK